MQVQTLEHYTVRAVTEQDSEQVVDLLNACSMHDEGINETSLEEVHHTWLTPGFDMPNDSRLVCNEAGHAVAIMLVFSLSPYVRTFTWGRVHPDYRGRGIGTSLLQFAEDRARAAIPKAPPGTRVLFTTGASTKNESAFRLFNKHGLEVVRYFSTMQIDFTGAPPAPQWPAGLTVRNYVPGEDDRAVYQADEDAFTDHWGHVPSTFEEWKHWMQNGEEIDPSLWFLVMDGDQIAGLAMCNSKTIENPDIGWVDSLGVRRQWRKRGLGLALLLHAFGEFYRRGKKGAGLGVDAQSLTGATRLYDKAGMHVIRQYARFNKEIRAGVEISTQSLPGG